MLLLRRLLLKEAEAPEKLFCSRLRLQEKQLADDRSGLEGIKFLSVQVSWHVHLGVVVLHVRVNIQFQSPSQVRIGAEHDAWQVSQGRIVCMEQASLVSTQTHSERKSSRA